MEVAHHLNNLSGEMTCHLHYVRAALATFSKDEVNAIQKAQTRVATGLLNLSTVVRFS